MPGWGTWHQEVHEPIATQVLCGLVPVILRRWPLWRGASKGLHGLMAHHSRVLLYSVCHALLCEELTSWKSDHPPSKSQVCRD